MIGNTPSRSYTTSLMFAGNLAQGAGSLRIYLRDLSDMGGWRKLGSPVKITLATRDSYDIIEAVQGVSA